MKRIRNISREAIGRVFEQGDEIAEELAENPKKAIKRYSLGVIAQVVNIFILGGLVFVVVTALILPIKLFLL